MGMSGAEGTGIREELLHYLHTWGMQEFQDEDAYYAWQRTILSEEELRTLHQLVENRHGGEQVEVDTEFYDVLARENFLSVLYSQRFNFFLTIGSFLYHRLPPAKSVLDFGCGVGILPIFFAQCFPDIQFVGIDRSSGSIARARQEAERRNLRNIRFVVAHVPQDHVEGEFDLILSLQALFQAEREPGLPSRSWNTFKREEDPLRQEHVERRTGLQGRLDALLLQLKPMGRMIMYEKTWNLGRRVFFQRALRNRGLYLSAEPVPLRYSILEEEVIDGPMYEVARHSSAIHWTEDMSRTTGDTLYRCAGLPAERMAATVMHSQPTDAISGRHAGIGAWTFRMGTWNHVLVWGMYETLQGFRGLMLGGVEEAPLFSQLAETFRRISEQDIERLVEDMWGHTAPAGDEHTDPCYENHRPSAQGIFENLPDKRIIRQSTVQDNTGRELHRELGRTGDLVYIYWANTFDERQLVIMDEGRAHLLEAYYEENLVSPLNP